MTPIQKWLLKLIIEEAEKYLTPELVAQLQAMAKTALVSWLRAQAASTDTQIDDKLVEVLAKALSAA